MIKKISDISFCNISLDKYKNDIDNINNMFDNLMKDRKIKKAYKKILKLKEKNKIKFGYNHVKEYLSDYEEISDYSFKQIDMNNKKYTSKKDYKIMDVFC